MNIKTLQSAIYLFILSLASLLSANAAQDQPNILWITIEDWSPDLSCYGTRGIATPHVDKLASEGIRYETAFTTSPVCSTSRSAMMTGFHQNYIGAQQHREEEKKPLPYGIRPIPHLFADAGYYTCLMSSKVDCNFLPDTKEELFMGADWKNRKADQPFFARVTFGGTHRPWLRDPQRPIDGKDVELPPYYADTPFIRRDWANGLEQMQLVDRQVGAILKRLEDEGIADNTLVFFIGDHGRCHIRGKQFLYDGGTRIPMIVRWPGKVEPGQVNRDLVYSIDLCSTALEAANITAPVPLHGKSLFNSEIKQRQYVFAARDKMGDTHDAMRSVRSKEHKLILNLMPERAYCQLSHYKEGAYPPLAEMNILHLEGKLTPEQALFLAAKKPAVELFDLRKDPHEINNVADDANYAEVKKTLLAGLGQWRKNVIKDQGVSDAFRAKGVFPEGHKTSTVGEWAEQNVADYDFTKNGLPGWFPTRSLAEWKKARDLWRPWVFRDPSAKVPRPRIPFTKKPKAPKTVRIMLIGDSTTIGNVPRNLNPDGLHLEGMIELIAKSEKLPPLDVINTGRGGETAQRLLGSTTYAKTIAGVADVDYLIVRLGINDWFKCEDFTRDFPVQMTALLDQLRKDHPKAKIILSTICRFMSDEDCVAVNDQIRQLAKAQKLKLMDIYTPYNAYLTENGPNTLTYRNAPLANFPTSYHAYLKPHTVFRKGWGGRPDQDMVQLDNGSLDPVFGDIEDWYGDRHPNSAGYHLIARETVNFLKPLLSGSRSKK